jgi:YebC/PmpR family DNA-binding regulatory protein
MSGHSKWAQIKRQKGANDVKRGQSFTRLSKAITLAASEGGGDPAFNPILRVAIDAAKAVNVPNDNIQRAIAKGVGTTGSDLQRVIYETIGFGGVAMLIECSTDNPTRTVAEVRAKLNKAGLKLATENSMLRLFQEYSLISLDISGDLEQAAMQILEQEHVHDIDLDAEMHKLVVICQRANTHSLARSLQASEYTISEVQRAFLPTDQIQIDQPQQEQLEALISTLKDLDDVEEVWTNSA